MNTFSLVGISKILMRGKFLAKLHIEEKMKWTIFRLRISQKDERFAQRK